MAQTRTGTLTEARNSFFVHVTDANTGKVIRIAIPGDVQVGLAGNPAELVLTGRVSLNATTFNVSASGNGILHITGNDSIAAIAVTSAPASGTVIANLPSSPRDGQLHVIADASSTSDVTPIVITAARGQLIGSTTTTTLNIAGGSVALCWAAGAWQIVASPSSSSGTPGVNVQVAGVAIPNNPHMTLNFTGAGVTVADAGGGVATVTIAGGGSSTVAGTGGSTVTSDGHGNYVVSSSVYSSRWSSYALTSASSGDPPDARYVSATDGVQIADGGAGGALVWSLTSPTNAGLPLDGMFVELPNLAPPSTVSQNTCPASNVVTAIMGGNTGTLYAVTLRFRGVVGLQPGYTAAPPQAEDGAFWFVNPTITATNEVYTLTVSDPAATYAFNRVPDFIPYPTPFSVYPIDFNKTIPIKAGAIVTLSAISNGSYSGHEFSNDVFNGGPYTIADIPSSIVVQPFDGQFALVNFVSCTPTSEIFVENASLLLSAGAYAYVNAKYHGGLKATDNGTGDIADFSIDNSIVATLTGSTFSGLVTGPDFKITGSLTQVSAGVPFIITQGTVTALTNSLGQIVLSGSTVGVFTSLSGSGGSGVTNDGSGNFIVSSSIGADPSGSYLLSSTDAYLPNALILGGIGAVHLGTSGSYLNVSASIVTVSGTGGSTVSAGGGTTYVVSSSIGACHDSTYLVLGLDGVNPNERSIVTHGAIQAIDNGAGSTYVLLVTGTLNDNGTTLFTTGSLQASTVIATSGITGSITQVSAGNPFLLPGTYVTLSTNSLGQWTINGSQGGGSGGAGADSNASYLVLTTTGSLVNERTLACHGTIQGVDGGAGSTYVLLVTGTLNDNGTMLSTTSSFQAPTLIATTGITGSHTQLYGGSPFIIGSGSSIVSTGSSGQITVMSTAFQQEVVFVAGNQTTQKSAFTTIAARSFDTTQYPTSQNSLSRYVKFIATLQNTSGSASMMTGVQLYDLLNSVAITSSSMNNSGSVSRILPYDVTSNVIPLGTGSGMLRTDSAGMYEVQLQLLNGSSTDAATCSNARLIVYYA